MLKRLKDNILTYIPLLILSGILYFVYDSIFGSDRWEWPTIFMAIMTPILIINKNFIGFIISLLIFHKKRTIIITYVLFIIDFIFILIYSETFYNFISKFEIINKLYSNDMASLNHSTNMILSNIFSIIIVIIVYSFEKNIFTILFRKYHDKKYKK